jgi:hypothetical protein
MHERNAMKERLIELIKEYRDRGTVKGTDFLLPAQDAACYVQDLAEMGISVSGCDVWRPWDEARSNYVEVVGGGDAVNRLLRKSDPLWNAMILKRFIASDLPPEAEMISFVYADSGVWDLVLAHAKCY